MFSVLRVFFALSLSLACAGQALGGDRKVSIIFSIEQSFPNSAVQNMDYEALDRTFLQIAELKNEFSVYSLFGCSQRDKKKLYGALSVSKSSNVPFFLDVWTSETKYQSNPATDAALKPYDKQHGECMSIESLRILKIAFGEHFAGIRLHEVSASNLSVQMYFNGIDWFPKKSWMYPKDGYYSFGRLEKYFKFASEENMILLYSDPYWLAGGNFYLKKPFVNQRAIERDLRVLSKKYPHVLVPFYANNEPLKQGQDPLRDRIDRWPAVFPKDIIDVDLGFGLSNQAWLCDRIRIPETACASEFLSEWSEKAIHLGAKWLQFEPYWYFFNYPRPSQDYKSFSGSKPTGKMTDNAMAIIQRIKKSLGSR